MKTKSHTYQEFTVEIENWPAEKDFWWFLKRIWSARIDYPCSDAPGFKTEEDAFRWAKNWIDNRPRILE
jgi:hypothetical protein